MAGRPVEEIFKSQMCRRISIISSDMKPKMVTDAAQAEYISECEEILQRVSSRLQLLEEGIVSAEVLGDLYRDIHTLKGSAFLFGYTGIGAIAHAIEAGLEPIRRFSMRPSASFTRPITSSMV